MDFTAFPFITKSPPPQIRMGIIGSPGIGKTTAIIGSAELKIEPFPNVVVLNFDTKLPAGIDQIDFTDAAIYSQFRNPVAPNVLGNPRTALYNFLETHARKFPPDVTLLIDSWTSYMNGLEAWFRANEHEYKTKDGDVTGWKVGMDRIGIAVRITNALKVLKCSTVITMHELPEKTNEGVVIGIKPLMHGQFADQMAAHLTAFFRAGYKKDFKENNGYCWRVKADDMFRPITPQGFKVPESGLLPATYKAYCDCLSK